MKQHTTLDTLIVSFEGDFDAAAAKQHQSAIAALPNATVRNVVLDFSQVRFLDSSGVGAVVFLFKRLRGANRDLALIGLTGEPERLIKLLRIDKTIPIYADLPKYWEAMKQSEPASHSTVHLV